jgi:hypothetical protein
MILERISKTMGAVGKEREQLKEMTEENIKKIQRSEGGKI